MMKRTIIATLALLVLWMASAPLAGSDVVILLSADLPPYIEAASGIEESLKSSDVEILQLSLKGKQERWAQVKERLDLESPKVVVPVGSLATALVARRLADVDIVYTMILNPATLLGDAPGGLRVTGVSMNTHPAQMFGEWKSAVPGTTKIGVLYDPDRSAAIVEEARIAALSLGIELAAEPVANAKSLPGSLNKLMRRDVDALWLFVDRTVLSTGEGLELIMLETLRRGVPILAPSDRYVRAGALMGMSVNYNQLGRQTGALVLRTLQDGALMPPPERPNDIEITVNEKVREALGIRLPSDFLEQVDRYVE